MVEELLHIAPLTLTHAPTDGKIDRVPRTRKIKNVLNSKSIKQMVFVSIFVLFCSDGVVLNVLIVFFLCGFYVQGKGGGAEGGGFPLASEF